MVAPDPAVGPLPADFTAAFARAASGFALLDDDLRVLSANAFAVYVLHPPVLIATTLAMRGLIAPPLVKFAVATAIAWSLTLLLSAAVCRQIPGLRRILA